MYKSDDEINHIGEGLVNCTLPKEAWTHAAHFAAACWLLTHPDYDAFTDMPDIIRRYNLSTGVANTDTDGYHETITQASLRATYAFLRSTDELTLREKVNALLASELGRSDWILQHWSKEVLFTPKARREWIEPDKAELPF